jgi:MarR family transcriptional regulator, organic hydroperoxide resistance regulator
MTVYASPVAATSAIQREIRQRRPFASRGQQAVVALLRTADVARRHLAAVVEPQGITAQQYNVLRILRGAGEEGLPTLEIAARMIEQTPGITRLLDRLEAKGLVRRQRCTEDRRQMLCWITAEGLRLLADLDGPVDAADRARVAPLSRAELDGLLAALDRKRANAAR